MLSIHIDIDEKVIEDFFEKIPPKFKYSDDYKISSFQLQKFKDITGINWTYGTYKYYNTTPFHFFSKVIYLVHDIPGSNNFLQIGLNINGEYSLKYSKT